MKVFFIIFLSLIILSSFFVFNNTAVLAEGSNIMNLPEGGCGDCKNPPSGCEKYCTGGYQLNDFIRLAINFSKWILGLVGAVALLAFIYGGFMFLISAGSSEKVNQAKQIIIGSVVGLLIVFTSYIVIGYVLKSLGYVSTGSWFTGEWK